MSDENHEIAGMDARTGTLSLLNELLAVSKRTDAHAYAVHLFLPNGLGPPPLETTPNSKDWYRSMVASGAIFSAMMLSIHARNPERLSPAQRETLDATLADPELCRRLSALVQAVRDASEPVDVVSGMMEHEETCDLLTVRLDAVRAAWAPGGEILLSTKHTK